MHERTTTPDSDTADRKRLSFADARRSPCLSCSASPCCTHLPVHSFTMNTLMDLDNALFLLNFDGVRLGLSASGEWSVYYARACRFLDPDGLCAVHDTDQQPNICATYNPYTCWYRRAFTGPVDDFVWFDRASLRRLSERVVFDEARAIVEVPSWEVLVAEQTAPPSAVQPTPGAPVLLTIGATRLKSDPPQESLTHSYDELRHPCENCAAHCCTHLVFRKPTPQTAAEFDHWRFSLGFPGVKVGIDNQGWSLILATTCRHLDDTGRCSVYGTDERPLRCAYYDAWTCGFKSRLGPNPQPDFRMMGLEEFNDFLPGLAFDAQRRVAEHPS